MSAVSTRSRSPSPNLASLFKTRSKTKSPSPSPNLASLFKTRSPTRSPSVKFSPTNRSVVPYEDKKYRHVRSALSTSYSSGILRKVLEKIRGICILPDNIIVPLFRDSDDKFLDTEKLNDAITPEEHILALQEIKPMSSENFNYNNTHLKLSYNDIIENSKKYQKKYDCKKRFFIVLIVLVIYNFGEDNEIRKEEESHQTFLIIDNETKKAIYIDPNGDSELYNYEMLNSIVYKLLYYFESIYDKKIRIYTYDDRYGPQSCDQRGTCTMWSYYLIDRLIRSIVKHSKEENFNLTKEYNILLDYLQKKFHTQEKIRNEINKYIEYLYTNKILDFHKDKTIFNVNKRIINRRKVLSSPDSSRNLSRVSPINSRFASWAGETFRSPMSQAARQAELSRSKVSPINSRFASWAGENFSRTPSKKSKLSKQSSVWEEYSARSSEYPNYDDEYDYEDWDDYYDDEDSSRSSHSSGDYYPFY
jgi:hypothetical protein